MGTREDCAERILQVPFPHWPYTPMCVLGQVCSEEPHRGRQLGLVRLIGLEPRSLIFWRRLKVGFSDHADGT